VRPKPHRLLCRSRRLSVLVRQRPWSRTRHDLGEASALPTSASAHAPGGPCVPPRGSAAAGRPVCRDPKAAAAASTGLRNWLCRRTQLRPCRGLEATAAPTVPAQTSGRFTLPLSATRVRQKGRGCRQIPRSLHLLAQPQGAGTCHAAENYRDSIQKSY